MASPSAGIFDSLVNSINILANSIDNPVETDSSQNPDDSNNDECEIWTKLDTNTMLVSHECTKISVAFSKEPPPSEEDCQSLCNSLEAACVSFVSAYLNMPKDIGKTLKTEVQKCVLSILEAVKSLCLEAKEGLGQLQTIGKVWESCNAIKSLPRDNKTAVAVALKAELSIIEDALEEFQQAIENEDDDDENMLDFYPIRNGFRVPQQRPKWTESDRPLLPPSLGLVKAAKACVKKTAAVLLRSGLCNNSENISQMDDFLALGRQVSPLVDDFVLSAYPPMVHQTLQDEASKLAEHLKKYLLNVQESHICSSDRSWTEFLLNAIDHNFQRISHATSINS